MKLLFPFPLAALALAGLAITAHGANKKKSDILVIVADDFGYGERTLIRP